MICPHCGATIRDFVPTCQMCGNEIDRDKLFKTYLDKGDAGFASGSYDAAIVNYRKALEFKKDASAHIKLGLTYQKKEMKTPAASEYVKALECDFSNERAHNLLVTIYVSQGRGGEIKAWYEKNAAHGREELSNKMIKVIETSKQFLEAPQAAETEYREKKEKIKTGKIVKFIINQSKSYLFFSAVTLVGMLLLGLAFSVSYFFKIDPVLILSATGFFFLVAAGMMFFIRSKKKNEKKKTSEAELMTELKAMASGEKVSADK